MDEEKLRTESPTTAEWFDITDLLSRSGPTYERFKNRLAGALGVSVR